MTELTAEELEFLQAVVLEAQAKAESVRPGPWAGAIRNSPVRLATLWGKLHAMHATPTN